MLIVQKYGGTSLADAQRIRSAAHRATGLARQGNQVVVVVSAQGETTDLLIEKAAQINRRGAAREMDAYLAAGEQMSAGLMAMAIGAMGYPAVSMTGWQAGIATDGVHGNVRIVSVDTHRIRQELDGEKSWWWQVSRGLTRMETLPPWAGAARILRQWLWRGTCTQTNARFLPM